MSDPIAGRLRMLEAESDAGRKMLADLDARRAALTATLLRIEGAIQVLKELGGGAERDEAEPAGPNGSRPGARPA